MASDREFIEALRVAVGNYFAAIDQWESAYCRYYRMPGVALPSTDLAAEQREFEHRRRELDVLLPRARHLCLRHGRADVFGGITRVSLGRYSPQERTDSAIGRSERTAVMSCLMELDIECLEAEAGPAVAMQTPVREPSLLDLVYRYLAKKLMTL